METIKKTIVINGHSIEVDIEVSSEFEEHAPWEDFYDTSMDYWPELKRKFESGEVEVHTVVVRAAAIGREGTDVLGGVEIGSPEDAEECIKDNEMIENALEALKNDIENRYRVLITEAESFKKYDRKEQS